MGELLTLNVMGMMIRAWERVTYGRSNKGGGMATRVDLEMKEEAGIVASIGAEEEEGCKRDRRI